MKTKILQFFHSKKLVRIACVLCAMLPILLVGLYAIPKNQNKVTAFAAESGLNLPLWSVWSTSSTYSSAYYDGLTSSARPLPSGTPVVLLPAGTPIHFTEYYSSSSYPYFKGYIWIPLVTSADGDTVVPRLSSTSPSCRVGFLSLNDPTSSYHYYLNYMTIPFFSVDDVAFPSFGYTSGYFYSPAPFSVAFGSSISFSFTGAVPSSQPLSDSSSEQPSFDGEASPLPFVRGSVFAIASPYSANSSDSPSFSPYVYAPCVEIFQTLFTQIGGVDFAGGGSGDSQTAYDEGYAAGYNKGQTEQLVNPLSYFITPVQTFLDTKLFGVVSFGMVLNIVLFVLIATIFIKMFAGG